MGKAGPASVRSALVRQWRLIEASVGRLDLEAPSCIAGWRNREVVAHLAVQPSLLVRFLKSPSAAPPEVSLVANLAGTASLAEMIDVSARKAQVGDLNFSDRLQSALPAIEAADLSVTVITIQGPISLEDYLRTRCVEAVVHGCDLNPAVQPDDEALDIAASALFDVLAVRRPDLITIAESLQARDWLDEATGRRPPRGVFVGVLPLMS